VSEAIEDIRQTDRERGEGFREGVVLSRRGSWTW